MKILVINCGSSSLKYQLIDMDGEKVLCKGLCERIGLDGSLITHKAFGKKWESEVPMKDHSDAFKAMLEKMTEGEGKVIASISEIDAVGHRVVHGAEKFKASCLVTPEVIRTVEELTPLAPLHNPACAIGLKTALEVFGENVPNVAVFDTAFHSTMPPKSYMYALPYEYYEKYGVRRYGFHGTSHRYISDTAAAYLGKTPADLKIVTCHCGNGSSIAAVDHGKVLDTSMGMTPLAGLIMGTRSGDIDPSIVGYLCANAGLSVQDVDRVLNKESGLMAISGVSSDKRDIRDAAAAGNERAILANDMLAYQVKKYVGAYAAAMGGIDVLVFAGGLAEYDIKLRSDVCKDMELFGIAMNEQKNLNYYGMGSEELIDLSAPHSRVKVLLISTNEELMIARETKAVSAAQ